MIESEKCPRCDAPLTRQKLGGLCHRCVEKAVFDGLEEFENVIVEAEKNGGNILIPSFAVGRTQEIIFRLGELYQKGISREIIDEVLLDLDEEELATRFARQKLPKIKHLEKNDFREKLYGYLSRRGFSYGISKDIISTLWEEEQE